jgi:hypothetical protein
MRQAPSMCLWISSRQRSRAVSCHQHTSRSRSSASRAGVPALLQAPHAVVQYLTVSAACGDVLHAHKLYTTAIYNSCCTADGQRKRLSSWRKCMASLTSSMYKEVRQHTSQD